MHISLQDLGRRQQSRLLQWRVAAMNRGIYGQGGESSLLAIPAAGGEATPRLGWLGRLWARGVDCSPEVAASGLDAMRGQNYGIVWGLTSGSTGFWIPGALMAPSDHFAGVFMIGLGAIMSGVGFWLPAYWLRRVCRPPVSLGEVEALQTSVTDELEEAYLRLVGDAARQEIVPETADRVRAALRAVGEAIEQLPIVTIPRAGAETLLAEAAQAQAEARAERDPVVAASHERKADALRRSAQSAQRSQRLMRRAAALRAEMLAQIESLRLGLSGFETASGDVGSLSSLADAVRAVATEAVAAADARAELDGALTGPAPLPAILAEEMARELRTGR